MSKGSAFRYWFAFGLSVVAVAMAPAARLGIAPDPARGF
jgi:hypothetical protein